MAFQGLDSQFNRSKEDQETDNHIAGVIIFMMASVGVAANSFVVFFISHRPSMQNAFGKLTMNQGSTDLIASFVYLVYYAPMVYFDIAIFKSDEVAKYLAYVTMVCYETGNLIHLFASINRVVAIFFPLTYARRFGTCTAYVLNIVAWSANIVPGYFAYLYTDCNGMFAEKSWRWMFNMESALCKNIGMYYDFAKNAIFITVILIADLITYKKCRRLHMQLRDSLTCSIVKARKMNEINFVTQALMQGLTFGAELVSYFMIANYLTNYWWKFFFTQFAFQSIHTLSGLITIVFNKELRTYSRSKKSVVVSSSATTTQPNNQQHSELIAPQLPPIVRHGWPAPMQRC